MIIDLETEMLFRTAFRNAPELKWRPVQLRECQAIQSVTASGVVFSIKPEGGGFLLSATPETGSAISRRFDASADAATYAAKLFDRGEAARDPVQSVAQS